MKPNTCRRDQIQVEETSENCNLLIYIALSAGGFAWSTAFGTTLSRIVSKLQGAPPSSPKYLLHPLRVRPSHPRTRTCTNASIYYNLSVRPFHPLTSTSKNTSIFNTLSQVQVQTRVTTTPSQKYLAQATTTPSQAARQAQQQALYWSPYSR